MNGKFLAFLTGVAVGGILGVLYAPAKGSETRRKLRESATDLSDGINDIISTGKEFVSEFTEPELSAAGHSQENKRVRQQPY
jgi:gas vesicle protein